MSTDAPTVLVGPAGDALVHEAIERAGERTAIWIGDRTDPELAEFEAEIGAQSR